MAYEKSVFGKMPDGSVVDQYTLTNEHGVSASFITLGAIWLTMLVPDQHGKLDDVVLGYDTVEKCLNYPAHFGEIVGRNANRIGGAAITIDGTNYSLATNDGANNLHSGPDYFSHRIWAAQASETSLGTQVTFTLFSPDGDQGYPGNANITVSYTLTADNSLIIDYHMICDADTIANFTNHAYFNLAGHQSGDAVDQKIWIDADYFTRADQFSIPTGEIRSVVDTPMDFTVMKSIKQDIDVEYDQLQWGGGYDHNWVLNHPQGEVTLCASATDDKSGRTMEVYTDLPGIQFYTGNFLTDQYQAKDGVAYQPRAGYCFETQSFPNAINQPGFRTPLLKAGVEYQTTTIYKFIIN